jgi:hypothetical protein
MTLYDQLEPEILEGFNNNKKMYEAGTEAAIRSLKKNSSWLNLTVGQVHGILIFSDVSYLKITDQTFRFGVNIIKQ